MAGQAKAIDRDRRVRIEAALRHPQLGDRERVVLAGYVHFEEEHGARFGHPGLCWPTDAELGAYLGRSEQTVRRARRALTGGAGAVLRARYVPPFGKLPSGEVAPHGANVFALAGYAAPLAGSHAMAVADAEEEVARKAHELALARARAEVLSEQPVANDEGHSGGSSHNAPWKTTPDWSLMTPGSSDRKRSSSEGEGGAAFRRASGL